MHYKLPGSSASASIEPVVSLRSASVDSILSGSQVRGRLVLEGMMRKSFLRAGQDDYLLYHWKSEEDFSQRGVDRSLPHKDHKGADRSDWYDILLLDTDDEAPSEIFLLDIAHEYYWKHCIALVPTSELHVYRRIRFCSVDEVRSSYIFDPPSIITIV